MTPRPEAIAPGERAAGHERRRAHDRPLARVARHTDRLGAAGTVRHRRVRPRRRGRLTAIVVLLIAALLVGFDLGRRAWPIEREVSASARSDTFQDALPEDSVADRDARAAAAKASPGRTGRAGATPGAVTTVPGAGGGGPVSSLQQPTPGVPETGPGTFGYAPSTGPVLGATGTLRSFQLAVEDGVGQDPTAFARAVDAILGDSRSWVGTGTVRFQRVPKGTASDFTLLLATPATSERLCAEGGLHTQRYTSCRLTGRVIINLARWLTAVPDYGAPLAVYRAYAINHEVGHQLGNGHELCPGPGRSAPVMQQQTLGLQGCVANAWPMLNGQLYTGPSVP